MPAMTATAIRGWLLQQPRASMLRVVSIDDAQHEVSVTSGQSWMAIAESIHALSPALIQAYDPDGKVLRAIRPLEQNLEAPSGAAMPLMLPPNTDPQSAQLIHFADLLAAAYRHSTDVAFERLASLFEAVNQRSASLERSLDTMQRLLRRAYQDQIENAPVEKEPDLIEGMVQSFIQGQNQQPPPNGKAG